MSKRKTAFDEKVPADFGMTDRQYDETRAFGGRLKKHYIQLRRKAADTRNGVPSNFQLDSKLYNSEFWFTVARRVMEINADPYQFVIVQFERVHPWPYPNHLGTQAAMQAYLYAYSPQKQRAEADMLLQLSTYAFQVELRAGRTTREILEEQADLDDQWQRYWHQVAVTSGQCEDERYADGATQVEPLRPKDALNALFCFCLAMSEGMPDIADRFRASAGALLKANPEYRRTVLGSSIPEVI